MGIGIGIGFGFRNRIRITLVFLNPKTRVTGIRTLYKVGDSGQAGRGPHPP